MRIGVHVRHWQGSPHDVAELARIAEGGGLDSIWVSETWGSDAVALATWIAAATTTIGVGTGILQMAGRTPAQTAMAALTLDHLSGGRFRLGLGVSGPQVVEGWHGRRSTIPSRARANTSRSCARSSPRRRLTAPGPHYPLPRPGGVGKSLKANVRPLRPDAPVYLAAMGPRNVALAAEIADGWLPSCCSVPIDPDAFPLRRFPDGFDVAPMVLTAIDDDLDGRAGRRARPQIALYVGAFGSQDVELLRRPRPPLRLRCPGATRSRQPRSTAGWPTRPPPCPTSSSMRWRSSARSIAVRDRLGAYARRGRRRPCSR